jgi:hypothetical protein
MVHESTFPQILNVIIASLSPHEDTDYYWSLCMVLVGV